MRNEKDLDMKNKIPDTDPQHTTVRHVETSIRDIHIWRQNRISTYKNTCNTATPQNSYIGTPLLCKQKNNMTTFDIIRQDGRLLYEYVRGSHLYGLNNEDSDVDTSGVYACTENELFGCYGYKAQVSDSRHDRIDTDFVNNLMVDIRKQQLKRWSW